MRTLRGTILAMVAAVAANAEARDWMLLNAVHHNPGEERWTTAFNDAQHLKDLGYNGQISKLEVQCGLTMDGFEDGIVPRQTAARRWMEQHAFEFRKNLIRRRVVRHADGLFLLQFIKGALYLPFKVSFRRLHRIIMGAIHAARQGFLAENHVGMRIKIRVPAYRLAVYGNLRNFLERAVRT